MKKTFSMFAVAVLALTMAACGGNSSSNNNSTESNATETPAVEAQATAAAEGDVLAEYEKLIEKLIELQGKVNKGDMSAMEEYTKLSQEMADFATKHAEEFANLTEAQVLRYQEIGMKLANAAAAAQQ